MKLGRPSRRVNVTGMFKDADDRVNECAPGKLESGLLFPARRRQSRETNGSRWGGYTHSRGTEIVGKAILKTSAVFVSEMLLKCQKCIVSRRRNDVTRLGQVETRSEEITGDSCKRRTRANSGKILASPLTKPGDSGEKFRSSNRLSFETRSVAAVCAEHYRGSVDSLPKVRWTRIFSRHSGVGRFNGLCQLWRPLTLFTDEARSIFRAR